MSATNQKMSPADVARLTVFSRSDLYLHTYADDEDAVERELHAHYVVVELPTGERWVHASLFRQHEMDDAAAAVERLVDRVHAAIRSGTWAGPVGNTMWSSTQPCYGSEAYAKGWRRYAAQDDLADGNYDPGTEREAVLRELAA